MSETNPVQFDKLSNEEAIQRLKTDPQNGLSAQEVEARRKEYGFNEVQERKTSPILLFAKKFWGLTPWMLEATILLSWGLHKYLDMYIVAALLIFNAVLSFSQEQKASTAVELLKKKLHVKARVLRSSEWAIIAGREIVPGDIVRVRAGDFVPADLKILDGKLQVDQSALTGESLAVDKHESDILYSGSIVKSGEANALTVLTGSHTYFGKTTELVQTAAPKLHTEEVIFRVVTWLLGMVGIFLAATFVLSLIRGIQILKILTLALVLLVSAIPVALPAMFTIAMAIGSMELVKQGVLITRLTASEDAASMDTLCVDKTGTITANRLSVSRVAPMNGYTDEDVLRYGVLASQEANHDPIDLAFIGAVKERQINLNGYVQQTFIPFDPSTRRTEALIQNDGKQFKVLKGAVNVMAEVAGLNAEQTKALEDQMHNDAQRGYKTLAVALAENETAKPAIVGLAALYDSPRPDSKSLIQNLKELGVAVKMLTGDALPIAQEIAKQVGLGNVVAAAAQVKQASPDNGNGGKVAENADVFADVYPEDKFVIVKGLQHRGHVVGMTGDGVNDSPALRQAEVGIAVSNATDVAKGAASAVLTNEGLSDIVHLVQIGRMIHQRIVTWILNKVIKTFLIVVFVCVAFLITDRYVVSVFDMVLLLFLVDFVTLSLSTDNVRWSKNPDHWEVGTLVRSGVILGVMTVVESLVILWVGMHFFGLGGGSALAKERLHTYTFGILFYSGLFTIFVVREREHFWESRPSRPLMIAIVADMLVGAILITFGMPGLTALPIMTMATMIGLTFLFSLLVNDWVKCALPSAIVEE